MFKVRTVYGNEIFTVYAVSPGGMFLFFRPPEPGKLPVWIWDDMIYYEPVEESV